MMHRNRRWMVTDMADASDLGYEISRVEWTLCTGFRCNGFLWLNDSTSEDAIQEYAVVRESDMAQIESITVGWCDPVKVEQYQTDFEGGMVGPWPMGSINAWQVETPDQHKRMYCERCG